jgi:hypothetical protein
MPRCSPSLLALLALGAPLLLPPHPAAAAEPPEVNAPYLPGFTPAPTPAPATPAPVAPIAPVPQAAPHAAPHAAPPGGAALTPPTPPGLAAGGEPSTPVPANPTTASDYMAVAAQAVAQRRADPAMQALGRAETRLISRSVPLFQTHSPADDPAVTLIEQARQAVRAGDFASAGAIIARATPLVAREENNPPPSPPVGMPPTEAPPGTVFQAPGAR